jgi:hypothetical protein
MMTWKRGFAMALCGCALWLFADRTTRAQDGPPKGDKPPRAEQRKDAPPPGAPRERREINPLEEDFAPPGPRRERRGLEPREGEFAPPGPPREELGPPGLQPRDERMGPPDRPRPNREGDRPEGLGMQGPPGDRPQGMPGGGMPGMGPGGMRGPYGPGMGFGMMRRPDPDVVREAELERQVQERVDAYRNHRVGSPEAEKERDTIQKEIVKLVNEQFNLRQERRENELKLFEEQIKRLRETIEKRQKAREEIIERRVKELLGQDDDMRF